MTENNNAPATTSSTALVIPQDVIRTVCKREFVLPCPACNRHNFSIVPEFHLNKEFAWACSTCGTPWKFNIGPTVDDITLQVDTECRRHYLRGYSLLAYTGGGFPQYVIVEDSVCAEDDEEARRMYREYHYAEHTCPTNFMRVEKVVFNGDGDPHGIYQFVRFVSKDDICKQFGWTFAQLEDTQMDGNGKCDYWMEIFPEMLRTSETEEPSTY